MSYLQSLSQNERRVVGQIAEGALRDTNFEKRRYDDYEYMYALRDIACNLQIEAVRYFGENTSENIALRRDYRGVAYIFEYVSFVYENMIYEARESLKKKTRTFFNKYIYLSDQTVLNRIAALPLFHEQLETKFKELIKNKNLHKLEPEGSNMVAYSAADLDFVIKIIKHGATVKYGMHGYGGPVSFEADIISGVELARERLGGLAADTAFVENFEMIIDGKLIVIKESLVQRKVVILRNKLKELAASGDIEECKKIIRKWFELQKKLWSRQVLDQDIKLLDNYGFDEASGKVVIIDFTNIFTDRGKYFVESYTSFLSYYNIANVASLNALSPGLGEAYLVAPFDAPQKIRKDFDAIWPEGISLHPETFRVPMSGPSITSTALRNKIREIFNTTFEALSAKVINEAVSLIRNLQPSEIGNNPDDRAETAVFKQLAAQNAIEINNASDASSKFVHRQELEDECKYYVTVRYNKWEIPQGSPAEELLKAYIEDFLPITMPGKDRIKLYASEAQGHGLIWVECYRDRYRTQKIGEGHVGIGEDISGKALRIIGMMNMALVASCIPNNLSPDKIKTEYETFVSFIERQYKEISGEDFPENVWQDISHGIRIILPHAEPVSLKIEEYYRLTIMQLRESA